MECFFKNQDKPVLVTRFGFGAPWTPTSEENRLFSAILQRQSNRSLFETRALPHSVLERMQAQAGREGAWMQMIQDEPTHQAIADLILEGDWQQWVQRSFRDELSPWLRFHDPAAGRLTWLSSTPRARPEPGQPTGDAPL